MIMRLQTYERAFSKLQLCFLFYMEKIEFIFAAKRLSKSVLNSGQLGEPSQTQANSQSEAAVLVATLVVSLIEHITRNERLMTAKSLVYFAVSALVIVITGRIAGGQSVDSILLWPIA